MAVAVLEVNLQYPANTFFACVLLWARLELEAFVMTWLYQILSRRKH